MTKLLWNFKNIYSILNWGYFLYFMRSTAIVYIILIFLSCNGVPDKTIIISSAKADSIFEICEACHRYNRKDVSEVMFKIYSDSIQKFKHDYVRSKHIKSHQSIKMTGQELDSIYKRIERMTYWNGMLSVWYKLIKIKRCLTISA